MKPASTPPRARADAQRNRDRMLDAAALVLSRSADAQLSDIAEAAGLSKATAYRHFADVDAIRAALAAEAEEVGRDLLQDTLPKLLAQQSDGVPLMDLLIPLLRAAIPLEHRWTVAISGQPIPDEGIIKAFVPVATAVFRQAQQRGEFREDLDIELACEGVIAITLYAVRRVHRDGLSVEQALELVRPYLAGMSRGAARRGA